MKKILSLILFVLLMGGVAFAQSSLSLEWNDAVVEGGTEVLIEGDGSEFEYVAHMMVRNNTSNDLNVVLKREVLEAQEGTLNYICWGLCFGPDVEVSRGVPIVAGAVSNEVDFGGHYMPRDSDENIVFGITRIKYTFYVEENEEDNVHFIAKFHISGASVGEIADKVVFSNAYPNPANSVVSIDYNLNSIDLPAQIAVYNMLGQNVVNQIIEKNETKLQLSVSALHEGVYFYSIIVGGEVVDTKKLVIRR